MSRDFHFLSKLPVSFWAQSRSKTRITGNTLDLSRGDLQLGAETHENMDTGKKPEIRFTKSNT